MLWPNSRKWREQHRSTPGGWTVRLGGDGVGASVAHPKRQQRL